MDLAILTTFLSPIIVVACLCVGYVIKNVIPNQKVNQFIPLLVLVLGVVLNIWACGILTLEVCVTGAVSGLASTGLYEAFNGVLGQVKLSTTKVE